MIQSFHDLSVRALRKIASTYNLHTTMKGYSNLTKEKLIANLQQHLRIENDNLYFISKTHSFPIPKLPPRKYKKTAPKVKPVVESGEFEKAIKQFKKIEEEFNPEDYKVKSVEELMPKKVSKEDIPKLREQLKEQILQLLKFKKEGSEPYKRYNERISNIVNMKVSKEEKNKLLKEAQTDSEIEYQKLKDENRKLSLLIAKLEEEAPKKVSNETKKDDYFWGFGRSESQAEQTARAMKKEGYLPASYSLKRVINILDKMFRDREGSDYVEKHHSNIYKRYIAFLDNDPVDTIINKELKGGVMRNNFQPIIPERMTPEERKQRIDDFNRIMTPEERMYRNTNLFLPRKPLFDRVITMKGAGAQPARNALHQMAKASYEKNPPREIGGFVLDQSYPTLKFYKDEPSKTIVVAIRGTNATDTEDLKADASIAINGLENSKRFKKDLDILKAYQYNNSPTKYDYYGVGHSLGGAVMDGFLDMNLLKSGISYNPALQPKNFGKNNRGQRIYADDDLLYKTLGHNDPNAEVRKTKKGFFGRVVKALVPSIISKPYEALEAHKLDQFEGGRKRRRNLKKK